jgi:hypothetical protein
LKNPIPADNVDDEVATFGDEISAVAVEMMPVKRMSVYFDKSPPEECLHVIVEPRRCKSVVEPDGNSCSYQLPLISWTQA